MDERKIWQAYEKQMNHITIDKERLKQKIIKAEESANSHKGISANRRYVWRVACCMGLIILTLVGSIYLRTVQTNNKIDFVVYAADGTTQKLSKEQPVILASSPHIYSSTYVSGQEEEVQEAYELNLSCKGEGVQSVTYSLAGEVGAADATVWLSKLETSTSEDNNLIKEDVEYDEAIEAGASQDLTIKESSYTVKAGEKPENNILGYTISKNEKGVYERADIHIYAIIQFENGDELVQRIKIHVAPFTEAGEVHQVAVYAE